VPVFQGSAVNDGLAAGLPELRISAKMRAFAQRPSRFFANFPGAAH